MLKHAPKSVNQAIAITLTEQHEANVAQRFTVDVPLELNPPEVEEAEDIKEPQRKSAVKVVDKASGAPTEIPEVTTLPDAFEASPDVRVRFQGGIWGPNEDRSAWKLIEAPARKEAAK